MSIQKNFSAILKQPLQVSIAINGRHPKLPILYFATKRYVFCWGLGKFSLRIGDALLAMLGQPLCTASVADIPNRELLFSRSKTWVLMRVFAISHRDLLLFNQQLSICELEPYLRGISFYSSLKFMYCTNEKRGKTVILKDLFCLKRSMFDLQGKPLSASTLKWRIAVCFIKLVAPQ